MAAVTGCFKNSAEQALESDANGYSCEKCKTKFYTDREVFAAHCPDCKNPKLDMVLGYVCADDNFVTLGARGKGANCGKCGKPVAAISIPGEVELKSWGASKKTAKEVGG